jgi:putative ABC transport system permease protein
VFASLKQGASGLMGSVRQNLVRGVLVMTEMATALVLLTGAALMSKSFTNALAVDPGFRPEGLSAMTVRLTRGRYPDVTAARAFFQRLEERVRGLPGVESVALTDETPFEGFNPQFNARLKPGELPTLAVAVTNASPSYGRVVGLQLVQGRLFDETDRGLSVPSVLLSESAARAFFPDGPAVGRRLPPMNSWPVTDAVVVGVVKNVPQPGVEVTPIPRMYFSLDQSPAVPATILVRSSGDPAKLALAVRHAVNEIDPLQAIFSIRTTESEVATAVAPRRLNATILSVFACLALVLAAVGLYGVMAYQVAQRTREIGLRIALGAEGVSVLSLVVRQGMRFAAAGAIVGVALSYLLARFLNGMLFAVSVHDAAMFVAAPAALLAVAIVACYLPARRAARIDPMIALRAD